MEGTKRRVLLDVTPATWCCNLCGTLISFSDDGEPVLRHTALDCPAEANDADLIKRVSTWQGVLKQSRDQRACLAHLLKHPEASAPEIVLVPPPNWYTYTS
jgi:hypothetical protein